MLQGNPLAVELAASWLGSYTPSQIAAQIAGGLESLANLRSDLDGRQRVVRAVFDRTWEKLSGAEQATLGRAAVFQGGFDFQAARAILVAAQDRENGENLPDFPHAAP